MEREPVECSRRLALSAAFSRTPVEGAHATTRHQLELEVSLRVTPLARNSDTYQ